MGGGGSKAAAKNYAPAVDDEKAKQATAAEAQVVVPTSPTIDAGNSSADTTKLLNSAFIFIKPHANNSATQSLVSETLRKKGLTIVSEGDFTGAQIDEGMLIDRHYYAIASKATLLKPKDIPVPRDAFLETFGVDWDTVLSENRAFNAVDIQAELGVDIPQLNALWLQTPLKKFGGGFYCGEIKREDKPSLFTFNAFFMTMRGKFVAPSSSIHYYVVEFDPAILPWKEFRGSVLGPTDCSKAPADSLRGYMFQNWTSLNLPAEPNVSDNCIHASASPLEGLGEKMNWLKMRAADDAFATAAMKNGISEEKLTAWTLDPQVNGKSVFDQLEDKDVQDCLDTMIKLNAVN